VLAKVVVLFHVVRNARLGSSQQHAAEGQPGDVFKDVGVFHGFGGSSAPRKGRMAGNQNAGDGDGIEIFRVKEPNDDCPGVADVVFDGDFFFRERRGDGNTAVEVVGVGGAQTGNGAASLRPRCRELRVGVSRSLDGRRDPSTMLPSRSVTTRSAALRLE